MDCRHLTSTIEFEAPTSIPVHHFKQHYSFQYGRQNIESAQNGRRTEEDSEDEGYSDSSNNSPADEVDSNKHNGTHKNGYIPNSNPLISRDLILVPEPPTPAKKIEKLVEKSEDNEISEKVSGRSPEA